MFAKHKRDKFCSIMEKYWSRFASNWDVLLHGSPAVDMYWGMKLAAGGELGMGVGEEDWGSSERDVLEDFARRTEGLVDVMVSRFDEAAPLPSSKTPKSIVESETEPWLGSGKHPNAADGVVFSGLGALSRRSLRDVSHWVETIYSYGDQAYGIRDNPTSDRKRRRRKLPVPSTSSADDVTKARPEYRSQNTASTAESGPSTSTTDKIRIAKRGDRSQYTAPTADSSLPTGIPPPIVKAVESSLDKASAAVDGSDARGNKTQNETSQPLLASLGDSETWMKYVKLGYGTAWGGKKQAEEPRPTPQPTAPPRSPSLEPLRYIDPEPDVDVGKIKLDLQLRQESQGYFLIGLTGDMADQDVDDDNEEGNWNNRIPLRTLYVEASQQDTSTISSATDSDGIPAWDMELSLASSKVPEGMTRLRPVVYVVRLLTLCFALLLILSQASTVYIHLSIHPSHRRHWLFFILP
jgi:hypothetical protein